MTDTLTQPAPVNPAEFRREPGSTPFGPPDAVGAHKCGHCAHDYAFQHDFCPGAIDSGRALWICPCGCSPLRCIGCRSTEDVDPDTWRCRSKSDCRATAEARLVSSPQYRMVLELRESAAKRIAEEQASRPIRTESGTAVPRPGAGKCECGCGAPTKSKFAMGHDARLRGVLQRAFAAGDVDAGLELAARGGVWATKAPGVSPPADPEAFVAARVAARLEASA